MNKITLANVVCALTLVYITLNLTIKSYQGNFTLKSSLLKHLIQRKKIGVKKKVKEIKKIE